MNHQSPPQTLAERRLATGTYYRLRRRGASARTADRLARTHAWALRRGIVRLAARGRWASR